MRCLIVEDEPLARDIIQTYLTKIPEWELVASCINALEAYEILLNNSIDIIFLDIEMPIISGVDFLKSLKNPPMIVFTTAYSKYAVKSYELGVIDYLLKPITFNRFYETINKITEIKKEASNIVEKPKEVPFIFVKHKGKLIKIKFKDIKYIKSEKEYSLIYKNNENILVSMHLKILENLLPKDLFSRVHRSYIIPIANVTSVSANKLQIGTDLEIPIGSTFKEKLFQKLNIR